jgi:hypothetical protein
MESFRRLKKLNADIVRAGGKGARERKPTDSSRRIHVDVWWPAVRMPVVKG